jgi:NAD+ synthase
MTSKSKGKRKPKFPSIDTEHTSKLIKRFIKQRVKEAGTDGIVIGLSGGVDSAVVCALAVQALGSENVFPIFLKNKNSLASDIEDVKTLCGFLNIDLLMIEIQNVIDQFSESVQEVEDSTMIEWMNIKPRILQTYLYFHSNKKNYLVCGAGNKSELMIGYYTKYGDGGVDILPIGDVYKTHVFELAEYLKIPPSIIKKPPSAGLSKGQTDEAEIGISYSLLDSILFGLETFQSDEEISERLQIPLEKVKNVRLKIYKSEHKRRGPVVFKLGVRTPTIDWRIPLTQPKDF